MKTSIVRTCVCLFVLCITAALSLQAQSTITNRWTGDIIGLQNATPYCSKTATDTWTVEQAGEGFVRLKNTRTGTYMHNENGSLGSGAIQPGWWSAQWTLKSIEGYTQIVNRWTSEYLHNENGKLELGALGAPGWWSAQWTIKQQGAQSSSILADATPEDPRKRLRLTPLSKDNNAVISGTQQNPSFNMRVNGFLYAFTESPKQKMVLLTTDGSIAKAGAQAYSQTDKRGYFLEKLEVIIEPTTGAENVYRDVDVPSTDANSGNRSITSSINVDAKLDKDGPGLGVGGGGASTFTQNLNGFKYLNNSDGKKLYHTVQMAMSSGSSYDKPSDLLDQGFVGAFSGTPLFEPPYQATNSMPFLAQGLWQTYDGNFNGKVTFKVTYKMVLRYVEKTNYFVVADVKTSTVPHEMTEYITIDFSTIK